MILNDFSILFTCIVAFDNSLERALHKSLVLSLLFEIRNIIIVVSKLVFTAFMLITLVGIYVNDKGKLNM